MRPPPRPVRAFSGSARRQGASRSGGATPPRRLRDHPLATDKDAFPLPRLAARENRLVVQHEQLPPWASDDRASALRSLAACASRVCGEAVEQYGAVSMTRGALASHSGQSAGSSYSDIDRISLNGPQPSHRYA